MENTNPVIALRTKDLILPSGRKVTIREQNGEDDEVLSNASAAEEGMSINNFISVIVVKDSKTGGKLTPDDVLAMRLRDKYYILIAARIFSLGDTLRFTYKWPDMDKPTPYMENLNIFIWDFHKPFPDMESDEYKESYIKPYMVDELHHIQTLSTGKIIRWDYADGYSEKFLLELSHTDRTKNSELYARRLSIKHGEEFIEVKTFKSFSPKEMLEIRREIELLDGSAEMSTEIPHPQKKGVSLMHPIIASEDFFYPQVI